MIINTSSNIKKRCGNPVKKNTIHSPQDTPFLGQDSIKAGARAVHHRLAVQTQSSENKDAEVHGMDIKVDTIQTMTNIPECISIPQIQQETTQDDHLQ